MRFDGSPLLLKIAALACVAFLHVPLLLIFLYAFTTEEKSFQFPPPGYTTKWFGIAWREPAVREALANSAVVASVATLVALFHTCPGSKRMERTKSPLFPQPSSTGNLGVTFEQLNLNAPG